MPARKTVPTARVSRVADRTTVVPEFVLMLYVAGVDRESTEAIKAITRLCEEHLKGRYQLAIIDIYQEPALARAERIVAVPTLIIKRPPPSRRLIGRMKDLDTVLASLGKRPPS